MISFYIVETGIASSSSSGTMLKIGSDHEERTSSQWRGGERKIE